MDAVLLDVEASYSSSINLSYQPVDHLSEHNDSPN